MLQASSTYPANLPLKVERYAQTHLPRLEGMYKLAVYRNNLDSQESLAIYRGDFSATTPSFVRIHSECFTGEVLHSLKCDCRTQLDMALKHIADLGAGVVVYLRQEGRGIGLGNKIKAYSLQEQGLNTVEANKALGLAVDLRDFSLAALILKDLGIEKILLNTNNPDKIVAMKEHGLEVVQVIPSLVGLTEHNKHYLHTKYQHMGHHLDSLFSDDPSKG